MYDDKDRRRCEFRTEMKYKKSGYDKIALQQILSDPACCPIDDKGRVLPPSNNVYQTISNLMLEKGSVINHKHVHTIINNNRNGFKQYILDTHNIKEQDLTSFIDEEFSVQVSIHDKEKDIDDSSSFSMIDINLVISSEKWYTIRPEEKIYGNRVYMKLRAGWADVIAEALWLQHQLDCVFTFKNNSVYQSDNAQYFLTIDGSCTECFAKFRGLLLKEPAENVDVIIRCKIDNVNAQAHSNKKRRQLRGDRRRKFADNLINRRKAAVVFRREEAGRLKKFGRKNPPLLPTSTVLRKAKQQRLTSKHGFRFQNPALNLQDKALHGKHSGQIHFIALEKFCCVYWLKEQLQIYISRCRKDPSALLTIDATGGIARRKTKHEPHIFLYQCMLVTNSGSVPVFQMVSADHRALSVAHFLRLIIAANAPIPRVVVTDFGWALMIAVVEIFGKCASFQDYLQRCHDAIKHKVVTLPSTYLRLDVSHLISSVSRWKCLENDRQVRRFYLRCIAKAYQIANFEELTDFIQSILCLALSRYIGYTACKEALPSEEKLQFLNDKIKGVSMKLIEEKDKHTDTNNDDDKRNKVKGNDSWGKDGECENIIEEEKSMLERERVPDDIDNIHSSWKSWIEDMYERAEYDAKQWSACDRSTISAYYNVKFVEKLKRYLLPYVAIWTGIMRPIFRRGSKIATSASAESEFCDVKTREFKGELPMRIDRYVLEHLIKLDNKVILFSNESDVVSEPNDRAMESKQVLTNVDDSQETVDQTDSMHMTKTDSSSHQNASEHHELGRRQPRQTIIGGIYQEESIQSPPHSLNRLNDVQKSIELGDEFGISINDEFSLNSADVHFFSTPEELAPKNRLPETAYKFELKINNATFDVSNCESPEIPEIRVNPKVIAEVAKSDNNIPADNEWTVQENWGGLCKNKRDDDQNEITTKRKRIKPSYLDDVPEWDYIREAKIGRLPVLRNGSGPKAIQIDGFKWNFIQTCAFDSIFQLAMSGLSTNRVYRDNMCSSTSPIIRLAQDVMEKKKVVPRHYLERAKALVALKESLYKKSIKTFTRTIKRLDAKCNAAHLAQYMFGDDPSYSFKVTCSCGYTNAKKEPFVSVNVDTLLNNGFSAIQSAINDCIRIQWSCFQCKREMGVTEKYGAHILIDTSIVTDPNYRKDATLPRYAGNALIHTLESIKKTVTIKKKSYLLVGVVDFLDWKDGVEHYVAYALSGIYWYKYDDIKITPETVNAGTRINPHLLMYAICSNAE